MKSNSEKEVFKNLPEIPFNPYAELDYLYRNDPNENKVDLSVGIYLDENGHQYVFKVVEEVESEISKSCKPKVVTVQ